MPSLRTAMTLFSPRDMTSDQLLRIIKEAFAQE